MLRHYIKIEKVYEVTLILLHNTDLVFATKHPDTAFQTIISIQMNICGSYTANAASITAI